MNVKSCLCVRTLMEGVVQLSSKIPVKIMEQHVAVQCITLYLLFPFKKMCLIFKG